MIIFSKNILACENEIYHIGKLRESSKRVMFKYISKINNKILTTENALKWMSDFSIANKCNTRNQLFPGPAYPTPQGGFYAKMFSL